MEQKVIAKISSDRNIIFLKVNEEDQTKIMDMMSEVVISRSLSNLRGGSSNKTAGTVLSGSTLRYIEHTFKQGLWWCHIVVKGLEIINKS